MTVNSILAARVTESRQMQFFLYKMCAVQNQISEFQFHRDRTYSTFDQLSVLASSKDYTAREDRLLYRMCLVRRTCNVSICDRYCSFYECNSLFSDLAYMRRATLAKLVTLVPMTRFFSLCVSFYELSELIGRRHTASDKTTPSWPSKRPHNCTA